MASFFYVFRVNSALAELGINPQVVNATYRSSLQQVGQASGNSPQEVALFITSQLPLAYRASVNLATIKKWASAKKIDVERPEMKDALAERALWDLI
jgi:hypothetical protein